METEAQQLRQAQSRSRADLAQLNESLAKASEWSERTRVGRRPLGPVEVPESELAGIAASEPTGEFYTADLTRRIAAMDGAILRRQADIDDVESARADFDTAERCLRRAESERNAAESGARRATERLDERTCRLAAVRREWAGSTRLWALEVRSLVCEAGVEAPTLIAWTDDRLDEDPPLRSDHEDVHARLLSEIDKLAEHWQAAVAEIDQRLSVQRRPLKRRRRSLPN